MSSNTATIGSIRLLYVWPKGGLLRVVTLRVRNYDRNRSTVKIMCYHCKEDLIP
jgi:hypothetical protein